MSSQAETTTKKIRAGKVLVRDSWWVDLGIHELSRTEFDPHGSTVGTSELQELHERDVARDAALEESAEADATAEKRTVSMRACVGACEGCVELRERVRRLEERQSRSVDRAMEFRLAAVELAMAAMRTNSLRLIPASGLGVNVNEKSKTGPCSPSSLRGGAGQEDYSSKKRARGGGKKTCEHGKQQTECRECARQNLSHLTRFCSHLQRRKMCKLCDLESHGTMRKRKFDAAAMQAEAAIFAEAMNRRSGLA